MGQLDDIELLYSETANQVAKALQIQTEAVLTRDT
jgi:hypothetical protein